MRASAPQRKLGGTSQGLKVQPCKGRSLLPLRHGQVLPPARVLDGLRPLSEMEQDRKNWRSVYDHNLWQKHRSPVRLIERLQSVTQSKVLRNIVPSMVWVGTVTSLVVTYTYLHDTNALPEGWPAIAPNAACKAFVSYTSVALSLLLVFRTNASYGRWDEARKLWGLLVNRSRDLARQTMVLFPEDAKEAKEAMTRWLVAYPRILRIFLQPEVTYDEMLKDVLKPDELAMLKGSVNPTIKGIHAMSEIMHKSIKDPVQQLQMTNNLTAYHDILGGCERLLRAPIPVSYTRHTARFLFCWITLLPFTVDPVGPWDIPVVVGIAGVLAAIEEIGVQCEEPFGILPLEVIGNRIATDVTNTLKDDEVTKEILRESMGRAGASADSREPVGAMNGRAN